jgi:hypothetical protein
MTGQSVIYDTLDSVSLTLNSPSVQNNFTTSVEIWEKIITLYFGGVS